MWKLKELKKASEDFRYLLNRGYPRRTSLELVGNRYQLTSDQRHLLHRGIFADLDASSRRKKKVPIKLIRNKDLTIDGYNVLITVEAGLEGRPLIFGDDGFIRDISGVSGNFKMSQTTEEALRLVLKMLTKAKPRWTFFLLDSPISMSGKLAERVRGLLEKAGLPGDARTMRVPEQILIGFPGIVATSDTAIIDRSERVFDLAGGILRSNRKLKSLLRLKK